MLRRESVENLLDATAFKLDTTQTRLSFDKHCQKPEKVLSHTRCSGGETVNFSLLEKFQNSDLSKKRRKAERIGSLPTRQLRSESKDYYLRAREEN